MRTCLDKPSVAAHVVVRLSFWEEDKAQSSRQLGSAVCDRTCF